MRLLDLLDSEKARMGMAMLAAGGPTARPMSVGQRMMGVLAELDALRNDRADRAERSQDRDMRRQALEMELEAMRRAAARQQALGEAASASSMTPAQQALAIEGRGPTPTAAAAAEELPGGFDWQGYANRVAAVDPMMALQVQQGLKKDKPKLNRVETALDPATNKPVQVMYFDDGSTRVAPFGAKPDVTLQNLGDRVVAVDKNRVQNGQEFRQGVSPDTVYSGNVSMRGQNMTDARAREANTLNAWAPMNVEGVGVFGYDKRTNTVSPVTGPAGAPVMDAKTAADSKRGAGLMSDIGRARQLLSSGPTGSLAGAGADWFLRTFGASTKGGDTAASLETLGAWMASNVPRMEGPQSNIDVEYYRQMAGQIGDRTVPVSQRLSRLAELERRFKDNYVEMPDGRFVDKRTIGPRGAAPAAGGGGGVVDWGALK
jgi:hypothetical protein